MPRHTKQPKNKHNDIDNDISHVSKTANKSTNHDANSNSGQVKSKKNKLPDKENDSSDISDIDENEDISDAFNYDTKKANMSKKESENDDNLSEEYIQTVVVERVVRYINLDNLIKDKQIEHKKEMKVIKDTKDQLEQFLIGYLDKVNEEYINLGKNSATLVKTETKTKAPPKMEDIGVCLIEGFRKYEIYNDDDDIKRVVKDFIKTIEDKREVKTRKYLKRMTGDPNEQKSEKKKIAEKTDVPKKQGKGRAKKANN